MTHHHIKENLINFRFALILCSFIAFLHASEVCKISYRYYPENLKDTTIVVPEDVVALSEYVYVPSRIVYLPHPIPKISLFIIIDHSCSMYIDPQKDKWGMRFKTTQDIIDSLRIKFPQSEMGISVFTEYLYFRPENDPYGLIAQCTGVDSGGYIPLIKLDSSYTPDGKMGWQILHEWMETDTVTETIAGQTVEFVDLKYRPDPIWDDWQNGSNSNINVAFEAAKHAMEASKYPKSNQLIIFFTDGQRIPHSLPDDYIQGNNTPMTIVQCFLAPGEQVPQEMITMITNIQVNGYSTSNPRSYLKEFDYDTLMKTLFHYVIPITPPNYLLCPINILVNNISPIAQWDSTKYTFADPFPLIGDTTRFCYDIDYCGWRDSITPSGDTILIQYDSSSHVEFDIVIENDAPDLPDAFEVNYWERDLGFYYKNALVTSINKGMDTLEIRFTETEIDVLYGYDSITVTITNSKGNIDSETFDLIKTDSCFTKFFAIAVDSTPTQNDGILQVYERDTVTAIFRNLKLPLDTIELSVPFYPTTAIDPNTVFSNGKFSFYLVKNGISHYSLRFNNLPNKGKIALFAINGRKIIQKQLNKGSSVIPLPRAISPGIYFLYVKYSGNTFKKKLILK